MNYLLLSAHDVGDDLLEVAIAVEGDDGLWRPRLAYGWISAIERHFDPDPTAAEDEFQDDPKHPGGRTVRQLAGQRLDGAEPRPMTSEEVLAYCHRVAREHHPELAPRPRRRIL
jgi:hypothetical protein